MPRPKYQCPGCARCNPTIAAVEAAWDEAQMLADLLDEDAGEIADTLLALAGEVVA